MRNFATSTLLVIPWILLSGCDSCSKNGSEGAPAASASAPAASSAVAPAPAPSASVGASGKMAHCPDAVPGAKTLIADVPGGVELSIQAVDPAITADIRARTRALLDAQKNQTTDIKHTGNGEGGGLLGRCPVVLKDTAVTAIDMQGGSRVTVAAKNQQEVDWLRRETRERQEDLEAAGSPAGAGKMSHCPSAVKSSATTLKNLPDGVSVVVTATGDDAIKDIRERAKHLGEIALAMSSDGGGEASHTGGGGGGGSIGRCPVVVKDTILKIKDVSGGTQVDVKAKKPADVPTLQAEAKERAAKFQLPGSPGSDASAPPAAPH